jgi:ABC-type polysaccharide/polyol phosphate transport system ATPase subunit
MSDIAIRASRLAKSYKLYDAPRFRLLDILGFNRAANAGVRLHHALAEISFEIRRGEKVAIIGRNGAGKSTLLKLVTKVITPTSGTLEVNGETRALLSLGTGFHPEFTGRENANAYLASLGFTGAELKRLVEEAIAFAELEDYADQPIKTYSTGMGMRLMFAAATMMKPDLLVIDEVLGVGDAYFQQKSFQHISAICAARQTTLLLVTHDIYNAAQLCDRMIWIDRGRMLIDADPATVIRAYQDSIREQEERRLRAKALGRQHGEAAGTTRILLDVQSQSNQAPPAPLHISRVSLLVRGVQIASAPLGEHAFDGDDTARLVADGSNWGEAEQFEGRLARALKDHGSPFHKVSAAFDVPLREGDSDSLSARLEYWCRDDFPFHVKLHSEAFERDLGILPILPAQWMDASPGDAVPVPPIDAAEATALPPSASGDVSVEPAASLVVENGATVQDVPESTSVAEVVCDVEPTQQESVTVPETVAVTPDIPIPAPPQPDDNAAADAEPVPPPAVEPPDEPDPTPSNEAAPAAEVTDVRAMSPSLNLTGIYGTGDIELRALRILDSRGRERHVYEAKEPVSFALDYRIRRHTMKERLHVVLAFKRDGVTDVMRLFTDKVLFDGEAKPEGTLVAHCPRLPLGLGRCEITVLVAHEGYYDAYQTVFFSMNPGVYAARTAMTEIIVEGTSQLYSGTGAVVDAQWSLT